MVRWRTSNSLRDTAVQDQHALLLFALHRHKAHVRPRHRLADSLRIGRVVLAALEVGLDVARRHQPDLMAKRRQFRGPMVRGRTGLDADQAWRKVSEELQQLGPPQLPSNNNRADGVDTVNLKHSLRDIQTDRGNLTCMADGSSRCGVQRRPRYGTSMPVSRGRPPHRLHRPWRASFFFLILQRDMPARTETPTLPRSSE
jgi:hypothetical protein